MKFDSQTHIILDTPGMLSEDFEKIGCVDDRIREFLKQLPAYSMGEEYSPSEHEWGSGGSSKTIYTVRKDSQPGLTVTIKRAYDTTSDDSIDYEAPPQVYLKLKDMDLYGLYDDLKKFFMEYRYHAQIDLIGKMHDFKDVIKESLAKLPAYSLEEGIQHSEDTGSDSGYLKTPYTVKKGDKPGLIITISQHFFTTSEDHYLHHDMPQVYMELKDAGLDEVYKKLRGFFNKLK